MSGDQGWNGPPARRGETIDPGSGLYVRSWSWQGGRRGRGVPWLGVFFVVFGALLLANQLIPGVDVAGSAVLLAIGVAFLLNWATGRNSWSLYVGAVLTSLGLSDVLSAMGVIRGAGWGTLFLGIALLAIAVIRAARHGGWGWQLVLGALLAISGGVQIADREIPTFGQIDRLIWPALILVLGIYLVVRERRPGRTRGL